MEDDNGAYRGRNRSFPHSKTMAFIYCLDKIDFYLIELNASAEFLISPWKLQFPNHSEGKKKERRRKKVQHRLIRKERSENISYVVIIEMWCLTQGQNTTANSNLSFLQINSPAANAPKGREEHWNMEGKI